jgi:hypothetical protein
MTRAHSAVLGYRRTDSFALVTSFFARRADKLSKPMIW